MLSAWFLKLENRLIYQFAGEKKNCFKFLSTDNKWNESDRIDLFIVIHK